MNSIRANTLRHIAISIATYKRPDSLTKLVESIQIAHCPEGVSIRYIIVDNDPAAGARDTVKTFQEHLNISYFHEPNPGIVAARNRGLKEVGQCDAIIFIDDDEVASPDWLCELLKAGEATGADVVTGPVVSVPPEGITPSMQRLMPFIQRAPLPDGKSLHVAATNNTLLRFSSWQAMGFPRFDESFSMTGGSDSAFFTRGHLFGWQIRHAARAFVYEEVPPERLTRKWVKNRAKRVGNVLYRMRKERKKPFPALGAIAVYGGYGLLNAPVELVFKRRFPYRSLTKLYTAFGVVGARFGSNVQEYRRSS